MSLIYNHKGYLAAANGPLQCPHVPILAEVMAVREALSWLKNRGLENVQIDSDRFVFCYSLSYSSLTRSYIGLISQSCTLLINFISSFRIQFIRRDKNQVAHVLTKE